MFGISLSYLFIVAILVLTVVYLWSRQKNLPPGPWGLPYIGYVPWLFYVMFYSDEELHEHLIRLGKRYGKIYSFTVFGLPFVVMNDHKVMKEAFSDLRLNDRGENEVLAKTFSPAGKITTYFFYLPHSIGIHQLYYIEAYHWWYNIATYGKRRSFL